VELTDCGDMSFQAFIFSTKEYCVDYDFEPECAIPEDTAWTQKEKWFCSWLAINDIREFMCLN
jgi:hypothetical protein